jgi:hypothetical protein
MTQSGADLRWRFCFDLVGEVHQDSIERADLPVVQAVSHAEEKIGDVSEKIDTLARRTIARDCVQIVKWN